MRAFLDPEAGDLILDFEGVERELFVFSLSGAREGYEADVETMPEPLRRFWEGTLSTSGKAELAEAASDLRDARLAWRPERLTALERWLGPESGLPAGHPFVLGEDEIDLFFSVLNDRRLTLAVLHDVDEERMDANLAEIEDPDLQRGLWEIHFLALVMESSLLALRDGEDAEGGE